jgi:hypothetical protein
MKVFFCVNFLCEHIRIRVDGLFRGCGVTTVLDLRRELASAVKQRGVNKQAGYIFRTHPVRCLSSHTDVLLRATRIWWVTEWQHVEGSLFKRGPRMDAAQK